MPTTICDGVAVLAHCAQLRLQDLVRSDFLGNARSLVFSNYILYLTLIVLAAGLGSYAHKSFCVHRTCHGPCKQHHSWCLEKVSLPYWPALLPQVQPVSGTSALIQASVISTACNKHEVNEVTPPLSSG